MVDDRESVLPERQRRRRYDKAFKRALVERTLAPGASVARIARDHDINANQLFKWRRQYLADRDNGAQSEAALVPVTIVSADGGPDEASPPEPSPGAGLIEVALSGGTVRIHGSVDRPTLQLVLSSLRR